MIRVKCTVHKIRLTALRGLRRHVGESHADRREDLDFRARRCFEGEERSQRFRLLRERARTQTREPKTLELRNEFGGEQTKE